MPALMAKEIKLVVHPATYFMIWLGALVLIPSWPYAIVLLYGILTAFFNAVNAREMHDLSYSFSLPVSRRSMVRARIGVMVIIEAVMLAIMALCICLRPVLGIDAIAAEQPPVGLSANISLLGCSFVLFGLFNLVFFSLYYRDPAKVGVPFLLACIPTTLGGCAFEAIPFIPFPLCALMASPGFENLNVQLAVLCAGVLLFVAMSLLAVKLAVRSFATYDG